MASLKHLRHEIRKPGRKTAIWIEVQGPDGTKAGSYVECLKSYVLTALAIFDDKAQVPYEVQDGVVYVRPFGSTPVAALPNKK